MECFLLRFQEAGHPRTPDRPDSAPRGTTVAQDDDEEPPEDASTGTSTITAVHAEQIDADPGARRYGLFAGVAL